MADGNEAERVKGADLFDGTGDYSAWKQKMRVSILADNLTGTAAAKYVFKRVTGDASAIMLAEVGDNPITFPFATAGSVFTALEMVYGATDQQSQFAAAASLKVLTQRDRSVEEYAAEFTKLSVKAGVRGTQAAAAFMAGLRADVQATVGAGAFTSFSDAVTTARRAEPIAQRMRRAQQGGSRGGGARGRGRGGTTQGRAAQTQDLSTIECYGCGKKGHMKKDCRTNGPNSQGGNRGGRQTQTQKAPKAEPQDDLEHSYHDYVGGNE